MLISWNLLNSLIKIPKDINPEILCDLLNERGIETYLLDDISLIYRKLLIGKVKKSSYDKKNKNYIYKVDVNQKYLNIVYNECLNINDIIVLAQAGIYLPGIKQYVENFDKNINARICSLYDLGLSANYNNHLINITKNSNYIGCNLENLLNYSDVILNIHIPNNRSDLFSYVGIAREILSFIYNKSYLNYKINKFKILLPELFYILKPMGKFNPLILSFINKNNKIKINISNNIYEYYSFNFLNILTPVESLNSLKSFLLIAGIAPSNTIEDIINFLIFFLGQHITIFDIDKIKKITLSNSLKIKIGLSEKKEIINKNDIEILLDENDITTYYNGVPAALSGIIVDDKYSIDKSSVNIGIEIAYFNNKRIINSINKHKIKEILINKLYHEIHSVYNVTINELLKNLILYMSRSILISSTQILNYSKIENKILINLNYVSEIIGIKEIKLSSFLSSFKALGFEVIIKDKLNIDIIIPSFRSDINTNYDIIEEILKILTISNVKEELYLYKNIIKKPDIFKIYYEYIKKARNYLKGCNFSEVINYSFDNISKYKKYKSIYNMDNQFIHIKNPLTKNSVMRKSLIPNIIDNAINIIKKDIKYNNFKIFEYGRVFESINSNGKNYNYNIIKEDDIEKDSPINEFTLFSGILVNLKNKKLKNILESNFLYIKGILKGLLEYLGITISFIDNQLEFIESNKSNYINQGEELGLFINIKTPEGLCLKQYEIGYMGRMNFLLKQEYEIILFEINFSLLFDILKDNKLFSKKINYEIIQFPSIRRDVSIIVHKKLSVNKIVMLIKNLDCCKNILKNILIFDIFINNAIGERNKSLSIALEFRSSIKTLTNDEISIIMKNIFFEIKNKFLVEIRDGNI